PSPRKNKSPSPGKFVPSSVFRGSEAYLRHLGVPRNGAPGLKNRWLRTRGRRRLALGEDFPGVGVERPRLRNLVFSLFQLRVVLEGHAEAIIQSELGRKHFPLDLQFQPVEILGNILLDELDVLVRE